MQQLSERTDQPGPRTEPRSPGDLLMPPGSPSSTSASSGLPRGLLVTVTFVALGSGPGCSARSTRSVPVPDALSVDIDPRAGWADALLRATPSERGVAASGEKSPPVLKALRHTASARIDQARTDRRSRSGGPRWIGRGGGDRRRRGWGSSQSAPPDHGGRTPISEHVTTLNSGDGVRSFQIPHTVL